VSPFFWFTSLSNPPHQLCPDEAVYKELNASLDGNWTIEHPPVDPSTLVDEIASQIQGNTNKVGTVISASRAMKDNPDNTKSLTKFHDEDDSTVLDLKRRALAPGDSRFIGKSSALMLVWTAMELKKEYMGHNGESRDLEKPGLKHRRSEYWDIKQVS